MPNIAGILILFCNQPMLYWPNFSNNPEGKPKYNASAPTPLLVRWEDKETEIITSDGRKVISHSYILLGTPMVLGSLVWLCPNATTLPQALSDWQVQSYFPSLPTVNQGAREVKKINKTPGIPQFPGAVYEAYLL